MLQCCFEPKLSCFTNNGVLEVRGEAVKLFNIAGIGRIPQISGLVPNTFSKIVYTHFFIRNYALSHIVGFLKFETIDIVKVSSEFLNLEIENFIIS